LKLPGIDLSREDLVGTQKEQEEIETGGKEGTEVGLEVEVGVDIVGVEAGVDHEVEEDTAVGVVEGTEVGAEVETGTVGVEVEIGTAGGEGVIPEVALEAEADTNTISNSDLFPSNKISTFPTNPKI